ncbi:unnamed protein product [Moneuplotes crassus]|uniref:Uncharacterized protein n=1 Tax=Euplotes crassus TaxID=5936 RepID=A0AAD2D5Z6_EUPCR|nr:unnamed protein product [Moneuplotes crassus]
MLDLYKSKYDYVEHKYFSVFQVPLTTADNQKTTAQVGNVSLYVNMYHESDRCQEEIAKLNELSSKYSSNENTDKNKGLQIIGLPTTDILIANPSSNIAQEILKFKPNFLILKPLDCNGQEMGEIFKFLKRYSPLFSFDIGKSSRLQRHFYKFLCDRYGLLHKFYTPEVGYDVIEKDIQELLAEQFDHNEYDSIIDPPEDLF